MTEARRKRINEIRPRRGAITPKGIEIMAYFRTFTIWW
jgi:hypothetical protein